MTDDDRLLLLDLRRMTDACGAFCMGVLENDLSQDDQLALSEWLVDMAKSIRKRALRTPVVIEGVTMEGGAVTPAKQTGQAVSPSRSER